MREKSVMRIIEHNRLDCFMILSKSFFLSHTSPKQSLRVEDYDPVQRVHSCPNTNCAGLLRWRGLEHFSTKKESVVEGVGLSFPGVPKDGNHLKELIWSAAQSVDEVLLILHLKISTRSAQSSDVSNTV